MTDPATLQTAYSTILQSFIETGHALHLTELAAALGVTPDEARVIQRDTAEVGVGCWINADTDYVASWAPFSNIATQYRLTINGHQTWFGQ